MRIIKNSISIQDLKKLALKKFGSMVKAVIDVEKGIIAVSGELHSDEEALLLQNGSIQENLWGINLYPEVKGEDWVEFDSMINVRPTQGNMSRGVDDPRIRKKILKIIAKLVKQ